MLHLRLRVPSEQTEIVVDLLEQDPTVTNLAVVPHGFRKPAGCLVLADVARENATAVVGRLRDLGLHENGSIGIDEVDTLLSRAADEAERVAPGAPDDGVVWVSVEQRLREDSRLSWAFVAFMTLATLIAGAGRILDEPILIVGAMVVGPEFVAIAAVCFALARPRPALLPRALLALGAGFGVALAIATAVWAVVYAADGFTREAAANGQMTDFIVSPDTWSFVVAALAGTAGVLSLTTGKSGPLVGVFISVTTIPAIGTLAICLACGIWGEAASALLQLGINLVGIVVAGTLTLLVQRFAWARVGRTRARRVP